MSGGGSSRRNALALSIGWWYMRRLIRKRGAAALAGLVAGEGLSLAPRRKRHPFRWLLVVGLVAGAGFVWWRRQQGGRDDWGGWDPVEPVTPTGPAPAETEPGDPVDLEPHGQAGEVEEALGEPGAAKATPVLGSVAT